MNTQESQFKTDEELFAMVDGLGISEESQIVEIKDKEGNIEVTKEPLYEKEPESKNKESSTNSDSDVSNTEETASEEPTTAENEPESNKSEDDNTNIKESDDIINTDEADKDSDEGVTETEFIQSETLKNLGLDSEEKIEELYQSWVETKIKAEEFEEKQPLVDMLESYSLTEKDLALLIEAKKGNAVAINKFLEEANLDISDLVLDDDNTELDLSEYTQEEKKTVNNVKIVSEYVDRLGYGENFATILNSWEESAITDLVNNKKNLNIVIEDMKTGKYQEIMSTVEKMKKTDFAGNLKGKDALDLYAIAKVSLQQSEETKVEDVKSNTSTQSKTVKKTEPKTTKKQEEVLNDEKITELEKETEIFKPKKQTMPKAETNNQGRGYSGFKSDEDLFDFIDNL